MTDMGVYGMEEIKNKEQIYKEYHGKVYGYIYGKLKNHHNAEDLCEDVFVKIYQKLDSFDSAKASISTWIYTITRNTVIDYLRSNSVHKEILSDFEEQNYSVSEQYTDERLEELAEYLEKLPERQRNIIVLHYYKELTLKEIADTMNISYSNTKLLHKQALEKIRSWMQPE